MGRGIINLRFWTKISGLILASSQNRYNYLFLFRTVILYMCWRKSSGIALVCKFSSNQQDWFESSYRRHDHPCVFMVWKRYRWCYQEVPSQFLSLEGSTKTADWRTDFRLMKTTILTWPRWRSVFRASPIHFPSLLIIPQVYPEVPMWWYVAVLVASFSMAMATIYTGHSGLPWFVAPMTLLLSLFTEGHYRWGLIVALIISAIFLPFVVTVYAITGEIITRTSCGQFWLVFRLQDLYRISRASYRPVMSSLKTTLLFIVIHFM